MKSFSSEKNQSGALPVLLAHVLQLVEQLLCLLEPSGLGLLRNELPLAHLIAPVADVLLEVSSDGTFVDLQVRRQPSDGPPRVLVDAPLEFLHEVRVRHVRGVVAALVDLPGR